MGLYRAVTKLLYSTALILRYRPKKQYLVGLSISPDIVYGVSRAGHSIRMRTTR